MILSVFWEYVLSATENKSFSPLLHPIAIYYPYGSYLFVKPGDGRRVENLIEAWKSFDALTLGIGAFVYESMISNLYKIYIFISSL